MSKMKEIEALRQNYMIGLKRIKELRAAHVFDFNIAVSESQESTYTVTKKTNTEPLLVHVKENTFTGSNNISMEAVIDELINVIEYSISS